MQETIQNIKNEALAQIMEAKDVSELEKLRITYLGRNGKIQDIFKKLKGLKIEEKKQVGNMANEAKGQLILLSPKKGWNLLQI